MISLTMMLLAASNAAFGAGESGDQFLKIGVGAKACAMAGAFTAVADDPTASYWNPSGLSQADRTEVTFMHNFWLVDMNFQYLAIAVPSKFGNWGVSATYSSSGDIPKYDDFQRIGDYSAYDAAIDLAYSNTVGRDFHFGVSLKGIQQKIEEEDANGFAGGAGILYRLPMINGMRLGAAIQNVGPKIKFIEEGDPLPLVIKGGISYQVGSVLLAGDIIKYNDSKLRRAFGGEITLFEVLSLRGGYDTRKMYSLGTGMDWRNLSFGYAFQSFKEVDISHRISLGLKL